MLAQISLVSQYSYRRPARAPAITKFLKPYVLKKYFTNNFVSAQVIQVSDCRMRSELAGQDPLTKRPIDAGRHRSGEDPEAAGRVLAIQGHPHSIRLHVTRPDVPREGQYRHGSLTAAGVKLDDDSHCKLISNSFSVVPYDWCS